MSFLTSSPVKRTYVPGPDDSGVSVQLGDLTTISTESGELDPLDPEETKEAAINIEDAKLLKLSTVFFIVTDVDVDYISYDTSSSIIEIMKQKYGHILTRIVYVVLAALYTTFFTSAIVLSAMKVCGHDVRPLIYLTVAVLVIIIAWFVKSKFRSEIKAAVITPAERIMQQYWYILKWILSVTPVLGIIAIVVTTALKQPSNLMSLVGWTFCAVLLLVCSRAPRKVNWRPVLGGFALQFYFAALILKWDKSYELFNTIGDMFTKFLSYSDYGATFVFGNLDDHFFAFKVLPVIIFFSCVITMLYYLGVMQAVISKIAFVMRVTLGTTAAESLCAAGNIFVGQTEAPIMIRPFLSIMTRSELHAVLVAGFATIAGGVMAAYILKGVSATHLITASVMNAPAALAVSKLLYPELGHSQIANMKKAIQEKQPFNNVVEAAAAGASAAISLVANVGANLIAFVALLYFANSLISWFGAFVCFPELSFEVICSYALMPLAYIMGVEWKDAGAVAKLIGIKTFLNEFVAYDSLAKMIKERTECSGGSVLSVRSEIIATYALCGFANLSSIGIQLGGLGPMAPNRLGDLAQIAVSALFGGIITNLMTACIA
ncbi:unnamed protein product, partial [Candidula unifasciata]